MMETYTEPITRECTRWMLVHWVVAKNRLYLIVEDQEFRDLVQYLKPRSEIPSANTLAKDIREVYDLMKIKVIDSFTVCLYLHSALVDSHFIDHTISAIMVGFTFRACGWVDYQPMLRHRDLGLSALCDG